MTTLGELQQRILYETNRDINTYGLGVNNAILSAIKYLEFNHPWLFQKQTSFTIPQYDNSAVLPSDFSSVIALNYIQGTQVYGLREGFQGITYAELSDYYNLTNQIGQPMKWALYNQNVYIYPKAQSDIVFNLIYNYKDATYPTNPTDTSIWFSYDTIDMCRYKALEIFYRDTLQAPEIAQRYYAAYADFQKNLITRNNYRNINSILIL